MTLNRKQRSFTISRWIGCSLIVWSLCAGLPLSLRAEVVRISYSAPGVAFLPLIVARQNGYFDEKGLTAQLIQMGPQLQVAGVINGELDYVATFQPVVRAALQGAPLRVVAVLLAKPGHWLVSKPAIKSIAALKGARIGIQQFGGGDHYSAREILAGAGVDPDKDVTFLQIGAGPTRLAALIAQAIDASPLTEIETMRAQALNYSVLKFAGDVMELPLTGISTSLAKIDKQPQQVQRVVQCILKALQYVRQNKKGSVKILADWLKLDPAQADKAYDLLYTAFSPDGRASDEGFNRLIELERKAGRLKNDVPISRVADWSFLKEAP
jgi:ABC-type nitrate/sulfonate/bicarbonate transport system substrate-binding protein